MAQNTKKLFKQYRKQIFEFIRLNIAGFVFFWSTYGLYFVFDKVLFWEAWLALFVASLIAHIIFFLLDKNWVFTDNTNKRKTHQQLIRFAIIMGFNFFLNLLIVLGLNEVGISPYIGQFAGAFFFTFWNYFWFKLWVFGTAKETIRGSSKKASK